MSKSDNMESFNEDVYKMTSANNMPRITESMPANLESADFEAIFAIND